MNKIPNLTKIIITLSPKLNNIPALVSFINQGITIFRMNFSHGTEQEHKLLIDNLRQASQKTNTIITICLDTKGQEFRINLTKSSEMNVKDNDIILFTNKKDTEDIFIPIEDFNILNKGMKFFLDDGFLSLEILEVSTNYIKAKALNSHRLKNNKKVNFPGIKFKNSGLIDIDKEDILFGVRNQVDVIFGSFILNKEDVLKIKELCGDIPVYSKIEAIKGVENIDDIIDNSDGIMVARGDLGVETGFVEMFGVMKTLVKKCREKFRPVICATQMLESMTTSTIPLRSEISDIGNAVLDEYDSLMLSGETAVGDFPYLCTAFMQNIIRNAEEHASKKKCSKCPFINQIDSCIILETSSHSIIKSLYNKRLGVNIYVISEDRRFLSIINLYRGIIPLQKSEESVEEIGKKLKEEHGYKKIMHFSFNNETEDLQTINILN
ncbi:pyruvate kinase (KPYK) [Vairimorpha necatrix]|uniref:Pyruvate kinase n=1 Tax=Vairimorpha necatrix TaxID=6039 RepID=A0AAX4JAB5_9MICR